MDKKKRNRFIIVCTIILAVLLALIFVTGGAKEEEPIRMVMKDAVLHEHAKISFFGMMDVNPALISAYTVTAIIFVFALIVRIFVIPKFSFAPGKFQLLLEQAAHHAGIGLAGANFGQLFLQKVDGTLHAVFSLVEAFFR